MIKKFIRFFLLFFLLLSLCQVTLFYLRERSQVSGLTIDANETELSGASSWLVSW